MSSLAQAVYDDFRKSRGAASSFCPVVLNSKQERQQGGAWNIHWYTSQNSGKDLWRLKKEKPELFAQQEQKEQQVGPEAVPPGFEATAQPGWHYNRERNIFFIQAARKFLWFDEDAQIHRELREGDILPMAFTGGATSVAAQTTNASVLLNSKEAPPPKHVSIMDLHRAAQALKTDINHLDRPTSMLGVFGGTSTDKVEVAARSYHEKLLRRLGAYRSLWSDDALCAAVQGALDDVGACEACPAAVALVTGRRIAAAASPGARFCIVALPADGGPLRELDEAMVHLQKAFFPTAGCVPAGVSTFRATEPAPPPAPPALTSVASCRTAAEGSTEALCIALTVGQTCLADDETVAATSTHLLKGRPRAASIALLRTARCRGAVGPLAGACARFTAAVPVEAEAPPTKRPKITITSGATNVATCNAKGEQVRVRHILLRYAVATKVIDPVRRKQVRRSLEEAEAEMLEVLAGLEVEGTTCFPRICREVSECQSALKGGELAGDLGWLDRTNGTNIQQDRTKSVVRPQVPMGVLKAAFELGVGEVHDLVTSDLGVHLLQRTA